MSGREKQHAAERHERGKPSGARLFRWGGAAALAAGLLLPAQSGALAQSGNEPRQVPVETFLDMVTGTIDDRQKRIVDRFDTSSILNQINFLKDGVKYERGDLRTRCYFDFGDVGRFRSLVSAGLTGGVVVDPQYIEDLGLAAAAIYQNLNTFTIAFSGYEERYNGYVILRDFVTTPESRLIQSQYGTYIHEAIHSAAFGAGRTDLDVDEDMEDAVVAGGPEYLGYYFFLEQAALAEAEQAALSETRDAFVAMQAALKGKDPEDDEALIEQAVADFMIVTTSAAEDYLRAARAAFEETEQSFIARDGQTMILDRQMARELVALWGGKADWDRLIEDAEGHVSALQRFREGGSVQQGLPPYFEAMLNFFFKKSCLGN